MTKKRIHVLTFHSPFQKSKYTRDSSTASRTILTVDRSLPSDSRPVLLPSDFKIARRPKVAPFPTPLTNGIINGHAPTDISQPVGTKRKRSLEEIPGTLQQALKKEKIRVDQAIVIEDSHDKGAIVIEDD